MALHPGEKGVCSIHGEFDEFCGLCVELKQLEKDAARACTCDGGGTLCRACVAERHLKELDKTTAKQVAAIPPSQQALLAAAKLYIKSRLGDKYKVTGIDEDEDSIGTWQVYVEEKDKPYAAARCITVPLELLKKIIADHLDLDHLTGKKEMPEKIHERIQEEFSSGIDDLFSSRE